MKDELLLPILKAVACYTLIEILGVVSLYAVVEQSVAHTDSCSLVPPTSITSSLPHRTRHAHFPSLRESSFWSVFCTYLYTFVVYRVSD
jgi:hypothetical protein